MKKRKIFITIIILYILFSSYTKIIFTTENITIIEYIHKFIKVNILPQDTIQVMQEPTTREENTATLQRLLDLANKKGNLKIKFPNGVYELDTCYISSNTELILSEDTVLTNGNALLFINARPEENKFTEYNGHGNITIRNGTIKNSHFFSMIHGKNILIENVNIQDIDWDHAIEIAGCKNVTIKNCIFKGIKTQVSDRQYVEYIQLDQCNKDAFPRFVENSLCYDNTPNQSITIVNCKFKPSDTNGYENLYTAIGSHAASINNDKNIKILNNKISNASYAGLRLKTVENVEIKENLIENCYDSIKFDIDKPTKNIEYKKILIKNNNLINCSNSHIYINALSLNNNKRALNIIIKNNNFRDCLNYSSIVAYGCNDIKIENNIFSNIYKVYTIYNSENIIISNNICEKILLKLGEAIDCNNLLINNNKINLVK